MTRKEVWIKQDSGFRHKINNGNVSVVWELNEVNSREKISRSSTNVPVIETVYDILRTIQTVSEKK